MSQNKNEWKVFSSTLFELISRGFKKPSPLIYFLSIILLAGGVGFWYPLLDTGEANLNSAMTYVFAILAAVVADFFTSSRGEDFLEGWNDVEKDFTVLVVGLVVFIASFSVIAVVLKCGFWAWLWMFVAAIMVWLLWWILLEPQKFGIPISRETVEQSTIGDPMFSQSTASNPTSLRDLRSTRLPDGGEHE